MGKDFSLPICAVSQLARFFLATREARPWSRAARDQSLKSSPIAKSYFTSSLCKMGKDFSLPICAVSQLARFFFATRGARLCSRAARDQSLKGSPMAKSYFTSSLCKMGKDFSLPICAVSQLARFFLATREARPWSRAARDQSLKSSPIAKSYFTSTFLPLTM